MDNDKPTFWECLIALLGGVAVWACVLFAVCLIFAMCGGWVAMLWKDVLA